jgi:hypothetical protein
VSRPKPDVHLKLMAVWVQSFGLHLELGGLDPGTRSLKITTIFSLEMVDFELFIKNSISNFNEFKES